MADITILRRQPGQKIARPVQRACSRDELVELMRFWAQGRRVALDKIDTDEPIAMVGPVTGGGTEFFAFTEER